MWEVAFLCLLHTRSPLINSCFHFGRQVHIWATFILHPQSPRDTLPESSAETNGTLPHTLKREVSIFMRPGRLLSSTLLLATALTTCVAPGLAKTRSHKSASSKPVAKRTGQRSIDDQRATQIQQALVHSGYMTGTSGHWDAATETAMQKFQSDNGWQTKLMPDSRAIIKLGLGPSQASSTPSMRNVSAPQTVATDTADTNLSQR